MARWVVGTCEDPRALKIKIHSIDKLQIIPLCGMRSEVLNSIKQSIEAKREN
jgi:hypothetical protein